MPDLKNTFKFLANPEKHKRQTAERKYDAYKKAWITLRSVMRTMENASKPEMVALMEELENNIIGGNR